MCTSCSAYIGTECSRLILSTSILTEGKGRRGWKLVVFSNPLKFYGRGEKHATITFIFYYLYIFNFLHLFLSKYTQTNLHVINYLLLTTAL